MLITFEGLDGCGKSTQAALFADYLEGIGRKSILVREPGATHAGEAIRNILLDKQFNISSMTELMLFEAARAELVNKVILPSMEEGVTVICDRFIDSTIAYQAYGRGLDLPMVETLNQIATEGIIPDITFYFAIDKQTRLERMANKISDRMEGIEIDFYNRVQNGFEAISFANPRFKVINANQTIDEIHHQVLNHYEHKIQ